jgi:hypothetical protein
MMEWLATLFVALIIALIVGGLFAVGGARGPWPNIVWFFLVLFFATWAIGVWADPVGPQIYGVSWVGFFVTAVLIGLLIAAATPSDRRRRRELKELPLQDDEGGEQGTQPAPVDPRETSGEGVGAAAAVTAFLWIFLIVALSVVVVRFLAFAA